MSTTLDPRLIVPFPSRIYDDKSLRNILWHLHGSLLSIAFLILFPLGVIAIRSGSQQAFRYHWLLQTSGTILALTGIAVGVLTSKGLSLSHQYAGLAIGTALLIQPIGGWKHHINYKKEKRRTLISYAHMWLGAIIMLASWINIYFGMVLRSYHFLVLAAAAVAILCFIVIWCIKLLGAFKRKPAVYSAGIHRTEDREGLMSGIGNEFALDDFEEDEDAEDGEERQHVGPSKRL